MRAASKGVPGGARDACLSFDEDDQIQDDVNFTRVSLAFDIMFFCDIFLNHFTAYMPSKTTETDEKGVLQVGPPCRNRPGPALPPRMRNRQCCERRRRPHSPHDGRRLSVYRCDARRGCGVRFLAD